MEDFREIAFFDLDRTLLLKNSTQLFGEHFFKKGELEKWSYLQACFYYSAYMMGWMSLEKLIHCGSSLFFEGKDHDRLNALSCAFWEKRLCEENVWNSQVLWLWKSLLQRGCEVGLLTSAPEFIVRPIAEKLGADFTFCTTFQVDQSNKILSGGHAVTGESKKEFVLKKIYGPGGNKLYKKVYGFGDSRDDLPFLRCCDLVRLVSPRASLLKKALRAQKKDHFRLEVID